MPRFLALLRGINVGGNRKVPMAELRELAEELGFEEPSTYIQSGNLVFGARGKVAGLARKLEAGIVERFGFAVEVVVRDAAGWSALLATNPMKAAATKDPAHLLVGVAKGSVPVAAEAALKPYAHGKERVAVAGGALWIHYANGIARSKLAPAVLDRCAGGTVTARNWRTALELQALLAKP